MVKCKPTESFKDGTNRNQTVDGLIGGFDTTEWWYISEHEED
jgi:hypothetical protein